MCERYDSGCQCACRQQRDRRPTCLRVWEQQFSAIEVQFYTTSGSQKIEVSVDGKIVAIYFYGTEGIRVDLRRAGNRLQIGFNRVAGRRG